MDALGCVKRACWQACDTAAMVTQPGVPHRMFP